MMRIFRLLILLAIVVGLPLLTQAQKMSNSSTPNAAIHHTRVDFQITELDARVWRRAKRIDIKTFWDGKSAPAGRRFSARLLWSDKYLYVRFEANQAEPLVVSDRANLETKTRGLWDRDVCEIFIAPDRGEPRKYFEFEIAPNGEWIDLGIDLTTGTRVTNWDYKSKMQSAARVEKDRVVMAIKIPWAALGKQPKVGDVWLGNLFRCIGSDPGRGYLAWRPTMTETPSFHVPEKFGEFVFEK